MATVVKSQEEQKLALKRVGPSDYGLKLRHNGEIIDLRVTGTYVSGQDNISTVRNAWIWTARIDGKVIDAPETLLRKRDAIRLLIEELNKRGVKDFKPSTLTNSQSSVKAADELVKQKADTTHPMFRPKAAAGGASEETAVDPILRTTVRIKGTTLVGVVVAKTTGTQERLRLEFPEGHKAWALREVVEDVSL